MTSNPFAIQSVVIEGLLKFKPIKSVLDVGCGSFCKFGLLAREYIDGWGPHHYDPKTWETRIDAIEAYTPYINSLHSTIYNKVYNEDLSKMDISKLDKYDIILNIDTIEHFTEAEGERILMELWEKTNKAMIIGTPSKSCLRGKFFGDDFEHHLSFWPYEKFKDMFSNVKIIDNSPGNIRGFETYTAVLMKVDQVELC